MRIPLFVFSFLFVFMTYGQDTPEKFLTHKVKKKETLYGLSRQYKVTIEQIKIFNPLIEKIGLKKKMQLKIPVYPIVEEPKAVELKDDLDKYLVLPKETKWRLAYRYGITIQELESLNPQIKEGLKIGQEIIVPKRTADETRALEESFNYYKVKPKEGFYRLEKKLGITQADLIALNPSLPETGLQEGMILKIAPQNTGDLIVKDAFLIEKVHLEDSVFANKSLRLAAFLPFKSASIRYNSYKKTTELLKKRNLHTIALDFYMGMVMAVDQADSLGISVKLNVFDSQNNKDSISAQINAVDWTEIQAVIGPLIPSNFDFSSEFPQLKNIPMVSPLSSNKVTQGENIFQSVSPLRNLRDKMVAYLDQIIDTTQNVMIIADTLNAGFVKDLEKKYPFAQRIRPEKGGYVLPDLVDSLLTDTLPNKVIFESQDLNLVANVISILNSQVSDERDVQLFTTLRTPIYENENISRKHLGNLKFTYLSGNYPMENKKRIAFKNLYRRRFGDYPSKEVFRAYDVTLDIILRLAYKGDLYIPGIGQTEYLENRFSYEEASQEGYQNVGFYLLQHQGYDIVEIKK